jgi:hypothetical protein
MAEQNGLVSITPSPFISFPIHSVHPAFNDTTDDKDRAIDSNPLAKVIAHLRNIQLEESEKGLKAEASVKLFLITIEWYQRFADFRAHNLLYQRLWL